MQTPNDACPAPAVLPVCLALCRAPATGEGQAHGTQNEQVRLLNTQPLPGFDLVSLVPQTRRSITTPALKPNAPARCWRLAGEYASASATASPPSAPRMILHAVVSHRSPGLLRHHPLARPEPRLEVFVLSLALPLFVQHFDCRLGHGSADRARSSRDCLLERCRLQKLF